MRIKKFTLNESLSEDVSDLFYDIRDLGAKIEISDKWYPNQDIDNESYHDLKWYITGSRSIGYLKSLEIKIEYEFTSMDQLSEMINEENSVINRLKSFGDCNWTMGTLGNFDLALHKIYFKILLITNEIQEKAKRL